MVGGVDKVEEVAGDRSGPQARLMGLAFSVWIEEVAGDRSGPQAWRSRYGVDEVAGDRSGPQGGLGGAAGLGGKAAWAFGRPSAALEDAEVV